MGELRRDVESGPRLVFHGFGCPVSRLEDPIHLDRLLGELPRRIHMMEGAPLSEVRHEPAPENGFSGFVEVAQSHVRIQTYPARGLVSVDIVSTEPFDVEHAIAELHRAFQPRRIEWQLLDREGDSPREGAGTHAPVGQERRRVASALGLEALR